MSVDCKSSEWVTNNAINYITTAFEKKKEVRKARYFEYLRSLPYWQIYEQHRGRPPLHPHLVADLQRRMAQADMELKRSIDGDWKACVVRYPEVLTHFYSQVKISMPREVDTPFGSSVAGGPAPRPPSVVNSQAQAAQSINRSATAPPKKQRRSSKAPDVDSNVLALLTSQLEALGGHMNRPANNIGRAKTSTPAPPQVPTPGSRSQRRGGKRRESKEYTSQRNFAPPHVPNPPMALGEGRMSFGFPDNINI